MGDASQVVKSWLKAIAKGPAETATQYLDKNLDWTENGLPLEESIARNPRPKWQGIQSKNFKYSAKVVCEDDRNVVVEFNATINGEEYRYCCVFRVSRGKIAQAHWYGDTGERHKLVKLAATA
jgi:ketosteroid isomerase-like protein